MNTSYKVTLAMPVYNVEKYIERALLSALNQTFESIEYLIIDDKGQDESMNIIHRVVATHPRGRNVRIINHGTNQGLGATRNTAIREAQGEYLFFMDSDDEILSNCIQLLYNKIFDTNLDWVMGSYAAIVESPFKSVDFACENRQFEGKYCLVNYILSGHFISITTWNKLYSLNFLRKNEISCIPNHLNEDAWFFFQIILATRKCKLISEITYFYYKIENSITDFYAFTEEKKLRITSQYIEIDKLKKDLLRQCVSDEFYPLLLCITMRDSLRYAYEVNCLNVPIAKYNLVYKIWLRYKNRVSRDAIQQLMSYPSLKKEVFSMPKKRTENFVYWLASSAPYLFQYIFIIVVRFIRK